MTKHTTAQAQVVRPRTFYGITAKQFITLVQTETNPQNISDMLAFARKRIADHSAKHPSRVARWKRVEAALVAKAAGGTPAATFVDKPVRTKRVKTPTHLTDLDALIKASGMDATALMLALAAKVTA